MVYIKREYETRMNTGLCKNSTPNGINSHHHILTEEEVKTIKHYYLKIYHIKKYRTYLM